jgi:hypothetical protein
VWSKASAPSRRKAGLQRTRIARVEVEYAVHEPLDDAVIEIYFYSIFGNLHSHFSTEVNGDRLELAPGRGLIEFLCPELPLEVASFNVEASIRRRGSSFTEHVDYKHATSVSIAKGKPVHGAFHTPHTWRRKNVEPLERDDTAANVIAGKGW